eukprot:TRINITY_DN18554_c0_g2_i1.p1 TRINITY_DN18554_c0_g2~~TRINITY_DN18554_c0_g2_i1.p1  ORF type:complete len:290 (+),score=58.85 TRINITY_DN18554_c0_g2_i1:31-870(+)
MGAWVAVLVGLSSVFGTGPSGVRTAAAAPTPVNAATDVVRSAESEQKSAILLLHGSGDSGDGFQQYLTAVDGGRLLDGLEAAGVQTLFPDSAVRPYRLAGGRRMAVWFDRTGLPPTAAEDTRTVEESVQQLIEIVRGLQAEGIPAKRIAVGGFSMGGGIALQLALRYPESVGAVFALSSYMCTDAAIFQKLEKQPPIAGALPPIFMAHGEADGYIRPAWGKETAERLQTLGATVTFKALRGIRHELSRPELSSLSSWLAETLQLQGPLAATAQTGKAEL